MLAGKRLTEHVQRVIAAADAGDMRAVQLLWDRGWGRPPMAAEDAQSLERGLGGIQPLLAILNVSQANRTQIRAIQDGAAQPGLAPIDTDLVETDHADVAKDGTESNKPDNGTGGG
jgi:hypothetical protein